MEILNQFKKAVASFTLGALLFGFVTPVANAQLGFSDDAEIPSWAFDAIDELMAQGVVSGNDDGSFAPNRQLNRAEVSKIIVIASGVDIDTTGGPHFPDVQPGAWYYDYVETMYNNGWINGYPDGQFRPEVGINRAEIAKMVVNAFELDTDTAGAPHFDDVTSGDWFFNFVETAYNYGLMRGYGDGTFGPADPVTRAQTVKIVYDSQLVVSEPSGPAAGTLEVTLSADTPRGTNIPFNATSVPFTTVEMTASDDSDVEISSLTFTRLGLGDNDDFDNVWLEIDGFKVGNDKSVNNDDIVELRFNPPVVVPAGQTVVADLVTSLEYSLNADGTCFGNGSEGCNIGHHNRFAIVSGDDVVSTAANVVGDFPVEGEEMEVADYQVTQLEFTPLGSDTTIDVGDNFIEIGKFRFLNQSSSNKDVELRALTMKNDGVAELEDVLENVALYVSGEQVSAETIIDGDYVTFRLDNGVTGGYILEDGDSRIFSIRADIVSAEKGDSINFKVDNFEDIVGVEIGTSFGVKAVSQTRTVLDTSTDPDSTTDSNESVDQDAEDNFARLRAYSIDSGDLNVSRDPSSLGTQEYAPGSNDVVFMTARLTVDQPLIVDGVTLRASSYTVADLDGNGTANELADLNRAFDNFRIFLNDKLIDSENDFSGTTLAPTLDFNTTFEIAGTSVLKVVANIEDDANTGAQVKLAVSGTDFQSPEYISTGDQVEESELLGSAEASFVQVEKSILIITKSDGLGNGDDIVAGVIDVSMLAFVLDNNDSGDVNVTSVTIQGVGEGTPASQYANFTAAIFVDGTQQGSSKNLDATTGQATFNDLSVIIPSAGQKELVVVVDTVEAISNSNPAVTVTVNGAGTTSTVATTADVTTAGAGTAEFGDATANSMSITLTSTASVPGTPGASGTSNVALAVGDQVVISSTGALDVSGAEIKTVASVVTAGTDTVITVTEAFAQTHLGEEVSVVVTQYPVSVSSFTVANAVNIQAGDVLSADLNDDGDFVDANEAAFCTVASVSGQVVTCVAVLPAPLPVGTDINEAGSNDKIAFNVIAVDVDNVENGQSVEVQENGVVLGADDAFAGVGSPRNDVNCGLNLTAGTYSNYLCGSVFDVVDSGTLTVENETFTSASQILVANTNDVEVLRVRLTASDDDIEVRDLYFKNVSADLINQRLKFKLKDASGAIIEQTQMLADQTLHFQLSDAQRIRVPKDGSAVVSVVVDVNNITEATQTGLQLNLELDQLATGSFNGTEAVTAARGTDLDANSVVVIGTISSEDFVAYRTKLTFNVPSATQQPAYVSEAGGTASKAIFRFSVTSDAAYNGTLDKITFNITGSTAGVITDPAAGELTLRRYDDGNYQSNNFTDLAATHTVPGDHVITLAASETISGTKFFELRTNSDTVGTLAENDAVNVIIVTDALYVAPEPVRATAVATTENIIWSDRSNGGVAGSFLNGFELEVPTDATGANEANATN